ncbi:MAG: ArgR family transcriptional regulator [Spirochaetaceae bacterium]|jgi:transcriptional regulator of arginine metabolism|nr:ArgR family transcriptional regulator [Spirochaetaceae bacterium]
MKARKVRLAVLQSIIEKNHVGHQELLLDLMKKEGYEMTQATLSRDLRAMGVGKIYDGKGGYYFCMPSTKANPDNLEALKRDFKAGIISIAWSGNIVAIKTRSGHSDAVATALDGFALEDTILVTIGGRDDAVIAVLKEGVRGDDFMRKMRKIIPDL